VSLRFEYVWKDEWMSQVIKLVEERAFAIGTISFFNSVVLITPALTKAKDIEINKPYQIRNELEDQASLENKETEVVSLVSVDASQLPNLSFPILHQLTLYDL
jgi:hypothetical protein